MKHQLFNSHPERKPNRWKKEKQKNKTIIIFCNTLYCSYQHTAGREGVNEEYNSEHILMDT
jgi:hypothetical protein